MLQLKVSMLEANVTLCNGMLDQCKAYARQDGGGHVSQGVTEC
jgi:hypothetical protein